MSRVSCPNCEKQFRNESGRAYHLGWAHKDADIREPHQPDVENDAVSENVLRARGYSEDDARFWAELGLDPDSRS